MEIGRILEYWRDKAYGKEVPAWIAGILAWEAIDLMKSLEKSRMEPLYKAEIKTALGDILAMAQEICTLEKLSFTDLHFEGCQRAAQRCAEHIKAKRVK
jgi:hypothetical protein